jgi:tRNA-dihydrouridine synthase A
MRRKELHIAPMLDVSTREFRFLMRLLSRRAVLWTEMVVDETLVHCRDPHWHLALQQQQAPINSQLEWDERPIICQLGGNNPRYADIATRVVHEHGYDGIDLNCECPSHRVASARVFGAALMKDPTIAVAMISSINKAASAAAGATATAGATTTTTTTTNNNGSMLVSVKMRIGVDDDMDSFEALEEFVQNLVPHCRRFVIHARKVYTQGLNPDQNRRIPPLNYRMVYRLCEAFPECDFILNGGIETLVQAKALLFGSDHGKKKNKQQQEDGDGGDDAASEEDDDDPPSMDDENTDQCDTSSPSLTAPLRRAPSNLIGVMMGRAARDDPLQFWDADRYLFGQDNDGGSSHHGTAAIQNRRQLFDLYCAYLETVYPRRCCDDDPRVTMTYPSPDVKHTAAHCPSCRSSTEMPTAEAATALPREVSSSASSSSSHQQHPKKPQKKHGPNSNAPEVKITAHVIDRSLKPVWGVLHGCPGSRKYRCRMFELARDLSLRNCGPAHILRCAVASSISDELLDRPLEPCG